jgi:hypothetical protein
VGNVSVLALPREPNAPKGISALDSTSIGPKELARVNIAAFIKFLDVSSGSRGLLKGARIMNPIVIEIGFLSRTHGTVGGNYRMIRLCHWTGSCQGTLVA